MHKKLILPIILIASLSSCKGYESYLKDSDANNRLTHANEYYEKKAWYKANTLYASLIPVVRNTKNYEELLYRYAYSFYNQKDYLSASYQFRTFVDNFPASKKAEECEFMFAKSLYKDAPGYTFDQTSTIKSMSALYSFTSMYKNSDFTQEANKMLDDCRARLEKKQADAAKLYFDMDQYNAAKVAFNSTINEYPDSEHSDFYHFMIVKSDFQYAKKSTLGKQVERYNDMLSAFNTLKDLFPQSKYVSLSKTMVDEANNQIKKLNSTNNEHN
ncbi:MAG TPA: outer membrane protein assembly factor BamD [Edaphocola sp.]|nr:outer membrane protein assembly factor BamD [Edaphocola sp.]